MTWFIYIAEFDRAATVDGPYEGCFPPVRGRSLKPLTEAEAVALPKSLKVLPRPHGFANHIFYQMAGRIFLSEPALEVLKQHQTEGWQAFPIRVASSDPSLTLVGDTFYFLNLYLKKNIVDLNKSDIPPRVLNKGTIIEVTTYQLLSSSSRRVAINQSLIGSCCLWRGDGNVLEELIFVADPLKEAWCALGMNPGLFEPCIDV